MGELGVSKEGVEAFGGGSPEADSTEGQGRTQVAPRG
jgi:hypothetical protein